MIALSITVSGGERLKLLTPEQRSQLAYEAGNGALNHVREHLSNNGGNWWARAAASTRIVATDAASTTIGIHQRGVALRRYGSGGLPGGKVLPKTSKYLSLPTHSGMSSPSLYNDILAFIPARKQGEQYAGALYPAEVKTITRGKRKGQQRKSAIKGSLPLYILLNWTKHEADPAVLPTDAAIHAAATCDTQTYINIITNDLA